MSDKPYPAGTRVVLTWAHDVSQIGETGTCTELHGPRAAGCPDLLGGLNNRNKEFAFQVVHWDSDGELAWSIIRHLRPLRDPDAEPVIEEVKEEAGAD